MDAYDEAAGRVRRTAPAPRTELAAENIQARIRGNLMMALSNRFGWLVLTTGNKSEMSVGYATLYGDMAGGFAVIKDVPEDARLRAGAVPQRASPTPSWCPESVLERAPSAELRPDQRDEDSLPPYEMLDRILEAYVEEDRGRDEIVADGLPADVVDEVIAMVDRSEYKRRQAPPGIRITPKAFGRDRRLPITNRFTRLGEAAAARPGRTAMVIRTRAQSAALSSLISTSQTQVVRPRCRGRATALTWPSVIGRRKVALFACPMAAIPSPRTASQVAAEQMLSASAA